MSAEIENSERTQADKRLPESLIPPPPPPHILHPDVDSQWTRDIWGVLVGARILNSLFLKTFFQPDEFYQALEPAWRLAFGPDSGAWITWEWKNQLRSSIHPFIIAGAYSIVSGLSWLCSLPVTFRTQLLAQTPQLVHLTLAALMDFYTLRFAERMYGRGSVESLAALVLTATSPWSWFASTRSLVNVFEASLTTIALAYWPWTWISRSTGSKERLHDLKMVKYCVLLIGVACVLRPTNLLIWIPLSLYTLQYVTQEEGLAVIQDASIYGSIVLVISNALDRLYYGVWTFPAVRWLQFNLIQDLAVFYGQNRIDYYLTEGLPILLTIALPFALVGLYQALFYQPTTNTTKESTSASEQPPLRLLAITAMTTPLVLSLISHKEVRFLYPILPILLILSARPFSRFFAPFPSGVPASTMKSVLLYSFFLVNVILILYTCLLHNQGVVSVTKYLRDQFERKNPEMVRGEFIDDNLWSKLSSVQPETSFNTMTVGFLMPCHSTPWRSHLIYKDISAWALTCEPPLGLDADARAAYVDEADVFYANPTAWMAATLTDMPMAGSKQPWEWDTGIATTDGTQAALETGQLGARAWPQYLVFFEQLEETMKNVLAGSRYEECWRGFNSHVHDDWRRTGDVLVWCVDGEYDKLEAPQTYAEMGPRKVQNQEM